MRDQQQASVWPYLEWLLIFNEEQGLRLELRNNGVGPALIKNVEMKLKGETIQTDSLFIELIGTNYFPHVTAQVVNRVLSPQNLIKPFEIKHSDWAEKIYLDLDSSQFEFSVCYESIYGEGWTTYGTEVKKESCK